jgi:HD-GYP domain-containing protein (c-di-GMP phosphodiesterase class II)
MPDPFRARGRFSPLPRVDFRSLPARLRAVLGIAPGRSGRELLGDAARGLLCLAAGAAVAVAAYRFGPLDPSVAHPLTAAAVGSSVGLGLLVAVGSWLDRLRRRGSTLGHGALAGVRALLATLAKRDGATAAHCTRVARVAAVIAAELGGLSAERLHDLRAACLLHDLGKLWVPLSILHKAGALDEQEWLHMRAHSADGSSLARSSLAVSARACLIIHQHHERIDGRGYPDGIDGSRILLEARIVAVADALDAMICDRPYRRGLPLPVAIAELRRSSGHGPDAEWQFDPAVVAALRARLPEIEYLYRRELAAHPKSDIALG